MGVLVPGDVLVIDNVVVRQGPQCRHHLRPAGGRRTGGRLQHSKIAYLPTYSPELNPCELVFGMSKNALYHWRGINSFQDEITSSFLRITHRNLCNFYFKCIYGPWGLHARDYLPQS